MSTGKPVYIVSAARSPVGAYQGQFFDHTIPELTKPVIRAAVDRSGIPDSEIDEVIIGCVLTAGKGQNIARQCTLAAGIPLTVPAVTINMLCGSSVWTVAQGFNAIRAGAAKVMLCGGVEHMSASEHVASMRGGVKLGDVKIKDSLLADGLTDAMLLVHMGITAEEVAKRYKITREEQDALALESQMRTKKSMENNYFADEIVGIPGKSSNATITTDEHPRPNTTKESLKNLPPRFVDGGTVTAGNASGLNDGAAMIMIAAKDECIKHKVQPLAVIVDYAVVGFDPLVMGLGPVGSIKKVLEKTGWTADSVDLYEINEAYAAASIAVMRDLGIPSSKVNALGGGIALGHPLAASGARVLTTLVYALKRLGLKRGVASLCIGGGMGIAIAVENAKFQPL